MFYNSIYKSCGLSKFKMFYDSIYKSCGFFKIVDFFPFCSSIDGYRWCLIFNTSYPNIVAITHKKNPDEIKSLYFNYFALTVILK